jgi:hypothetical protein
MTAHAVTSLGGGGLVDGFVRMIGTGYDDLGRRASVTSFGDTSASTVRNQIVWQYDGFGNVTARAVVPPRATHGRWLAMFRILADQAAGRGSNSSATRQPMALGEQRRTRP